MGSGWHQEEDVAEWNRRLGFNSPCPDCAAPLNENADECDYCGWTNGIPLVGMLVLFSALMVTVGVLAWWWR